MEEYFEFAISLKELCYFDWIWSSYLGYYDSQWVPEITHHCQKTPFLLVGTQIDLREDAATIEKLAKNKQKPVTLEQGEKLTKELKAVKYVECSALTQVIINVYTHINFDIYQGCYRVLFS